MFAAMTIREIHTEYISALKDIYVPGEASAITDIIFRHFANLRKSEIILSGHLSPDEKTALNLKDALQKLLLHFPVQYITGEAWFCNLKFTVNENVLIPRPETEELVMEAVHFLKHTRDKKVLDIGTGSGCIPVTIKKNVPGAEVISLDISDSALIMARANAVLNDVSVDFRKMDFLNEEEHSHLPSFDLIISNPPYIPENDKNILDKNVVLHEPHVALFVPQNDPLIFYRKILKFAADHLNKSGKIFLEIHQDLAEETAAIFRDNNFEVNIKKDISGNDRMLLINYCP